MTSSGPTHPLPRRMRRLGLTVVIAAGALVATSPPAFAFSPAPHTQLPDLQKNNYAGKPLRVITFVKADGHPHSVTSFDSRMLCVGQALVHSAWYQAASAAYHLGAHGTSTGRRESDMPSAGNAM